MIKSHVARIRMANDDSRKKARFHQENVPLSTALLSSFRQVADFKFRHRVDVAFARLLSVALSRL